MFNFFKNLTSKKNTQLNLPSNPSLIEDQIPKNYDFFNHYFDVQLIDFYNFQKLK